MKAQPLPENLDPASTDLPALLKRLHLPTVRRLLNDTERRAIDDQLGHREFLAHLIVAEVLNRETTRVSRMTRKARFPFLKIIDEFNFAPKGGVRRDLIAPYLAGDFAASGRNLILSGKSGRGKTHLAIAIAFRAIQSGADARFIASIMIKSSMTLVFDGGQVDCTRNTSRPRTSSLILTRTSPSLKVVTSASPSGTLRNFAILFANSGLALPVKIFSSPFIFLLIPLLEHRSL